MSFNIPKYSRTFHLTFSDGCTNDDKMLDNNESFLNKPIIITSKLDGSNFCMTNTECFARSHSGPPTHKSFDMAKSLHNQIKYLIPENFAVYAEYLFAKHSIHYTNLPHYLHIFNILDLNKNEWLSWQDVKYVSKMLNVPTVPFLFGGTITNNNGLKDTCLSFMKEKEFKVNEREGVVVRLASAFKNKDFNLSISKAVRESHVKTSDHWMHQEIVKNILQDNA